MCLSCPCLRMTLDSCTAQMVNKICRLKNDCYGLLFNEAVVTWLNRSAMVWLSRVARKLRVRSRAARGVPERNDGQSRLQVHAYQGAGIDQHLPGREIDIN